MDSREHPMTNLEDRARVIADMFWLVPDEKLALRSAILTFAREVEAETLERAAQIVDRGVSDLAELSAADIDELPKQYHGQASQMILSVNALQARIAKAIRALKSPSIVGDSHDRQST